MPWFYWISGLFVALLWLLSVVQAVWHSSEIADITRTECDLPEGAALPSVTVIVPARNEEAHIAEALNSLLRVRHATLDIIAVNDRSTDHTGEIMEMIFREASTPRLRVLHVKEFTPGMAGQNPCYVAGCATGRGRLAVVHRCRLHFPSGVSSSDPLLCNQTLAGPRSLVSYSSYADLGRADDDFVPGCDE